MRFLGIAEQQGIGDARRGPGFVAERRLNGDLRFAG